MIYTVKGTDILDSFIEKSAKYAANNGLEITYINSQGPYVTLQYNSNDNMRVSINITRKPSALNKNLENIFQIIHLMINISIMHDHKSYSDYKGHFRSGIYRMYTKINKMTGLGRCAVNSSHVHMIIEYGHPNIYECDHDVTITYSGPIV